MDDTMLSMPINATPYKHQEEAYRFTLGLFGLLPSEVHSRGAALLMEMGTGKTLVSIGVAGTLYLTGRIKRMLIVAPLSILGVWDEEFSKFATFPYSLTVLSGSSEKKKDAIKEDSGDRLQILVVNYESAWRLEKEIAAWKPDIVVADEGHKIKSHSTSAAKALHYLGTVVSYRILLTGTPVTNKAMDIFSQYKFLNPDIYGQSFYAFRTRYFNMTGYGNHTPVMKKSMEAEFTRRMHSIILILTGAEVFLSPGIFIPFHY